MIEVRARLGDGSTSIEVTGHGRTDPADVDGARACAIASVATETCIAYLQAMSVQFPDHIRFHPIEE